MPAGDASYHYNLADFFAQHDYYLDHSSLADYLDGTGVNDNDNIAAAPQPGGVRPRVGGFLRYFLRW